MTSELIWLYQPLRINDLPDDWALQCLGPERLNGMTEVLYCTILIGEDAAYYYFTT